jgi:hypothetical protein
MSNPLLAAPTRLGVGDPLPHIAARLPHVFLRKLVFAHLQAFPPLQWRRGDPCCLTFTDVEVAHSLSDRELNEDKASFGFGIAVTLHYQNNKIARNPTQVTRPARDRSM